MMPSLFEPLKLGNITLKNRVLMAPLTRNRADKAGILSDMTATYYAQRASAGLIITEATQVSPLGKGYINTPGIHSEEQVESWKNITKAVHAKDGKIFLQLWHVGRISHLSLLPKGEVPVAPSAIRAQAQTVTANGREDTSAPRALKLDEIRETIEDYRIAARNAKLAGFDGVEIHAANGYLIDQFIQDKTNQREDEYGGSAENRARFLLEVTKAILSEMPAGQIGVRLSPLGQFNDMGDSNPLETFGIVIEKMNELGLAYLHMVEEFPGMKTSAEEQTILDDLKAKWHGNYIANGGLATRKEADDYIKNNQADAIAFGRLFISNPDLPKRLELGAKLTEPDPNTFYGGTTKGYTDYPTLNESKAA